MSRAPHRISRVLAAVLTALLFMIGLTVAQATPAAAAVPPAAGQYVPLTPARIVSAQAVAANAVFSFNPLGHGGVPTTGVATVAFQLSARSTGTGSLEVRPNGSTVSATTNINYRPNASTTDGAVSALGTGNSVSVVNRGPAVTVYVDVIGYTLASAPATAGSTYVPLDPARIVNAAAVPAGGTVAVAPGGKGGVPATDVTAIMAHVIVRSASTGFVTVYPDLVTRPTTSDVNFGSDYYYTNLVPAKLGSNGQFRVYSSVASTVYVDVVGYYRSPTAATAGQTFTAVTPSRIVNAASVPAGGTFSFSPQGKGGVPAAGVGAVAFTMSATGTTSAAMTVYPAGITRPATGDLYYRNGGFWPVLQTSRLGTGGQITVYNGGTAPATIYVDVAGYYQQPSTATVPGAPTGVSAIAGAGQASLRWTAPVSNGGSALTGYRITAAPGGSTLDVTATTSAVFAGLTNGIAYTFAVSARNAIGIGPAGAASAAVTPLAPAVPGAPSAVTAVARDRSAQVSWQRPANDGRLPLNTYTVTALPGGASVTTTAPTTAVTFPGLTNGTAYTFTVTARNSLGVGPASAASPATTPATTVPDSPGNVSAIAAGGGVVSVSWLPSAYTGGNPVTGYTVTVAPGGRTVSAAGTATSVDVTGLTTDTQYTFTVTARTVTGVGVPSRATSPVTPDAALTPAARALSPAAMATVVAMTPTAVAFANAPAEVTGLQAGNVMIGGPGGSAPDGLLRRVVSVAPNGANTVVTTTDATLPDAYTDAAIGLAADLQDPAAGASAAAGSANAAPGGAAPSIAAAINGGGSLEIPVIDEELLPGVKVDGKVTLSVQMTLDHDLSFTHLPRLNWTEDDSYQAELALTATRNADPFDAEKLILEKDLTKSKLKTSIFKGPAINEKLRVYLYAKGSLNGGITANGSVSQTLHSEGDLLGDPDDATFDLMPAKGEITVPTASGSASIELGIRAEIVTQVAGQDEALIKPSLFAKYTLDPLGPVWWKVDGCGKIGVAIGKIFGKTAYAKDAIVENCTTLDQADGPLAQLTITPADSILSRGTSILFSVTTIFTGTPVTWTVTGTGNGTVTQTGLYTAPNKDGIFEIVATSPASGARPAQTGKAIVRVGVPGVPVLQAAVSVRADGVPAFTLAITGTGAVADYYRVVPDPLSPSAICSGWRVPFDAIWHFTDWHNGTGDYLCGLISRGGSYAFTVYAGNQFGEGAPGRSAVITFP